jgi:hypothetical protein
MRAVAAVKAWDAVNRGCMWPSRWVSASPLFVLPAIGAAAQCDAPVVYQIDCEHAKPGNLRCEWVASYFAPSGNYSADEGYYFATVATRGPLTAPRNGSDGSNRVIPQGPKGSPTSAHNSSNYLVDVVFTTP